MLRDTPPDLSHTGGSGGAYVEAVATESADTLTDELAISYARATYQASTDYLQNTQRSQWERNLRLVQSRHPADSKYTSDEYRGRSRLFRPKTRSARMKGEAAVAQAFFSTQDVVNIRPQNDDDPMQRASAALWHEAMNHRLTKVVPWFQTCIGAYQDAATYGVCASKQYWRHDQRMVGQEPQVVVDPETGVPDIVMQPVYQTIRDTLWVDIYPPENVRFDPSADWRDPIATSPYVIGIMATPSGRVKQMADQAIGKTMGIRWRKPDDAALSMARVKPSDPVELQRFGNRQTPTDTTRNVQDHELVWMREYILEFAGQDWVYYTLGDTYLLSDPVPLVEVYRHGMRPYHVGYVTIEAHKTYPSSKVEMTQDLQTMANDIANLRLDNQKLGLNPKAKVVAGRNVNLTAVRRHWPGEPILVQSPDDVTWDRPPDVTASAYLEQDRLNVDFDELQGSFSQSSVATNRNLNETVGGMNLLNAAAGQIGEYQIRTFAETWYEPVMRQLLALEQHYETDMTIFMLAADKAKLIQRFGVNQITDDMLNAQLTVSVNVGIGATDPSQQLNRLLFAVDAVGKIMEGAVKVFGPQAAKSRAVIELSKEIFGKSGYKDGERFIDFDSPSEEVGGEQNQMAAMQQQMQEQMQMQMQQVMEQAQQQIAQLQQQVQDKSQDRQMKFALETRKMEQDAQSKKAEIAIKQQEMERDALAKRAELALKEQEIKGNFALKVRGQQSKEGAGQSVNVRYDAQDSINQLVGLLQASTAQTGLHNKATAEALARVVAMVQEGQVTQQELVRQVGEQVAGAVAALAQSIEALTLPKRVVRGPDGRAKGVETVRTLQ